MSNKETILAVLPSIRHLDNIHGWDQVFSRERIILVVVQDGDGSDIEIPDAVHQSCKEVHHLRWKDIDELLGENNWIISRRDSAIRSFAWLWAELNNIEYDYVFTFDDDTKPLHTNHINQHVKNLNTPIKNMVFNTIPQFSFNSQIEPRGLLGEERKVYISHGLWINVPDMSAASQEKLAGVFHWQLPEFKHSVPAGVLYPMCGMNLCFRKELAPIMYFGLMGNDPHGKSWNIGRWDDMFAGWISKLWIDKVDGAVVSGSPYCNHQRASDLSNNIKKEQMWAQAPEIVELLEQLPRYTSLISTEKKSLFLSQLKEQIQNNFECSSDAIKHFLRCLDAAVLFSNYFE